MCNVAQILEQSAAAIDNAKTVGAESPSGKKLVRQMERRMQAYFRRIKTTFRTSGALNRVLRLYSLLLPPEIQESDRIQEAGIEAEFILAFSNWLETADPLLAFVFTDSILDGNSSGFEGSMAEWLETFGIDVPDDLDVKALLPQSVIDTARETAAKRVKGVNTETIKQLSTTIGDALENNLSTRELAKAITQKFTDMTKARAKLIAQTELNTAINDGSKKANEAVGADEKEWIQTFAADVPRDVHIANMGDGRIPIKKPFSGDGSMDAGSGNNNPFNCHCTVVYFGATEDAVRKLLGLAADEPGKVELIFDPASGLKLHPETIKAQKAAKELKAAKAEVRRVRARLKTAKAKLAKMDAATTSPADLAAAKARVSATQAGAAAVKAKLDAIDVG